MKKSDALHIAIIPDGNRRWAKSQGLFVWKGHEKSVENFRTLIDWCKKDPRVHTLTVWCFSTENWKRDPDEVKYLMDMMVRYLTKERSALAENNTRLLHSGRTDRIPSELATLLKDVAEETKDNADFTIHFALDYGGMDEVVRAVQRMDDTKSVTEKSIREHLDHPELPDIDLIIRTSGEQRTSNFFLWQAAYAEWVFCDVLFPEFSVEHLSTAIENFGSRKRRFGS